MTRWTLVAIVLTGPLVASAPAASGSQVYSAGAQAAKKKCKKKSAGAAKKKCKKKPVTPTPVATLPAPSQAQLAISPASHNFGFCDTPCNGGFGKTQAFTVANNGGQASGTPVVTLKDNSTTTGQ